MGILDKLTGGYKDNSDKDKFTVYVQFDDDDVIILAKDIDIEDDFIVSLHPEDKNYLEINDRQTGKQIKIFAKMNE